MPSTLQKSASFAVVWAAFRADTIGLPQIFNLWEEEGWRRVLIAERFLSRKPILTTRWARELAHEVGALDDTKKKRYMQEKSHFVVIFLFKVASLYFISFLQKKHSPHVFNNEKCIDLPSFNPTYFYILRNIEP